MTTAKSGDKVRIHYTGTLEDGSQFDSSEGRDPLEFELGSGQVIPGFDSAVDGLAVGENVSVSIEPENAYGERSDQLVHQVPRDRLPGEIEPEVGMQLQAQSEDGYPLNLVITEVADEAVTVDANHPLAGQTLNFDIELVEIVS